MARDRPVVMRFASAGIAYALASALPQRVAEEYRGEVGDGALYTPPRHPNDQAPKGYHACTGTAILPSSVVCVTTCTPSRSLPQVSTSVR
jgi:hypothetical protein